MLWVKTFHIVLIASWFAGLFYLPRIFVNLAMETEPAAVKRLLFMARKLYRFMTLIAVPALLCGLWLAYGERAAFRILRAVAGRLAAPLRLLLALPAAQDRPRSRPGRPRSDRAPGLLLLADAITSRGPPPGTAVL